MGVFTVSARAQQGLVCLGELLFGLVGSWCQSAARELVFYSAASPGL